MSTRESAGSERTILIRGFDACFTATEFLCPSRLIGLAFPRQNRTASWFELYDTAWIAAACLALLCGTTANDLGVVALVVSVLFAIRVLELLHVTFSILLYDRFSRHAPYRLVSIRRAVVLNLLHYVEVVLSFAIIALYAIPRAMQPELTSSVDALYFSVSTAATVGYGDILATESSGRVLVIVEVIVANFFVLLVLGRVLSLLTSRLADERARANEKA